MRNWGGKGTQKEREEKCQPTRVTDKELRVARPDGGRVPPGGAKPKETR